MKIDRSLDNFSTSILASLIANSSSSVPSDDIPATSVVTVLENPLQLPVDESRVTFIVDREVFTNVVMIDECLLEALDHHSLSTQCVITVVSDSKVHRKSRCSTQANLTNAGTRSVVVLTSVGCSEVHQLAHIPVTWMSVSRRRIHPDLNCIQKYTSLSSDVRHGQSLWVTEIG